MRKDNIDNKFNIDFNEFTVPTIPESEINAACEKIAEYLPKKPVFKLNFHTYGLIAACIVLTVIAVTALPRLTGTRFPETAAENSNAQLDIQESDDTELLDGAETVPVTPAPGVTENPAKPETTPPRAFTRTAPKTPDSPGAAKKPAPAAPAATAAPKDTPEPQSADTPVSNDDAASAGGETVAAPPVTTDAGCPDLTIPESTAPETGDAPEADDKSDLPDNAAAESDATRSVPGESAENSGIPGEPAPAVGGSGSLQPVAPAPDGLMTAMAKDAPGATTIESRLAAGEHTETVVLSSGYLNFAKPSDDGDMLTLMKTAARTENWSAQKLTTEFGFDPRPAWVPLDLNPEASDDGIHVNISRQANNQRINAVFRYSGAEKSLTVEAYKAGGGTIDALPFNSNVRGYNIYAEYDAKANVYLARFSYKGIDFLIRSEGLTQEEFITVLLSIIDRI